MQLVAIEKGVRAGGHFTCTFIHVICFERISGRYTCCLLDGKHHTEHFRKILVPLVCGPIFLLLFHVPHGSKTAKRLLMLFKLRREWGHTRREVLGSKSCWKTTPSASCDPPELDGLAGDFSMFEIAFNAVSKHLRPVLECLESRKLKW